MKNLTNLKRGCKKPRFYLFILTLVLRYSLTIKHGFWYTCGGGAAHLYEIQHYYYIKQFTNLK